ncbi:MAG TPA: ROK family protein [Blastocatellia bacterium]|nr:ROK family protein [Blastocatellia bacterium]
MSSEQGVLTIGVDLGGTKVETALIDEFGNIVDSSRHPTDPKRGSAFVIAAIAESARKYLTGGKSAPKALGIGVAGQVETHSGVVRFAPNIAWKDVPLGDELERALGIPVTVVNDVWAASWGEFSHGAGKGVDDLVCLFVGTGIGGGIVTHGRLLVGTSNSAGELGHTTVVAGGRKCHCPNYGCLEAYAGGWAIADRAKEAVIKNPEAGFAMVSRAGSVDNIVGATVSEAYHAGDLLAREIVKETGDYLAAGIVSIVNALNPSMLVLGGGIIEGMPDLFGMVEPIVRRRALPPALECLQMCRAALENQAGVIGAAALARNKIPS